MSKTIKGLLVMIVKSSNNNNQTNSVDANIVDKEAFGYKFFIYGLKLWLISIRYLL